jgi:hypothetical protein
LTPNEAISFERHDHLVFSLRGERVGEMRRWLRNYQDLKAAIEAICELNHDLLRPDQTAPKARRKRHD